MEGKKVYSRDDSNYVKVIVTQGKQSYHVKVQIPHTAIQDGHVFARNHRFIVDLKVKDIPRRSKLYEIEFERRYDLVRFGFIRNTKSKNQVSDERFEGSVILFSGFYIDAERRASKTKIRKEAGKMAGLRSTGPAGEREMNGSNYTNYEYNNAHKPFEGGLVQPK